MTPLSLTRLDLFDFEPNDKYAEGQGNLRNAQDHCHSIP